MKTMAVTLVVTILAINYWINKSMAWLIDIMILAIIF